MVVFYFKNKSEFLVFCIVFIKCKLSINLENGKCFDTLGCIEFTSEWTHPVYRPNNLLPADRHAVNTIFVLWTLQGSNISSEILGTNFLNGTKFNSSLKLFIHDFTSNGYTGWIQHLANTLLSYSNSGLSIISVDWAAGAEPPYLQAISNARLVALEIAYFLNKLKITFNLEMKNVHIIGHGVGAHIAGYVGKIHPPKRITALDPSGIFFENMPPKVHLHKEDAEYIEVLHTDMASGGQGNKEFLGHADFFANSGQNQPGCKDKIRYLRSIKRGDLKLGEILPGCSHKRSLKYYIESIINHSCVLLGVACKSYKDFLDGRCSSCGEDMESCVRLNTPNPRPSFNSVLGYYFVTSSSPPYCGEIIKVIVYLEASTPDQLYVNGNFNITIKQSVGDVNFLINENNMIAALRTNKQHAFLVFRATPPPLLLPINFIYLKWQHKPIPCYWCTPPKITKFMIYKLTDNRHEKPQWFCTMNTSYAHVNYGRQLYPCRENTMT